MSRDRSSQPDRSTHEQARAFRRNWGLRGRHEPASEARRADPDLKIVAHDKGGFASYSQCGMPHLVGGMVEDRRRLIARTVEGFERRGITVRLGREATEIDPGW